MEMHRLDGSEGSMEAPLLQSMTTDFEAVNGLVVRQQSQWTEVFAQAALLPYEAFNKYKVSELPVGRHAARALPADWKPTGPELDALPELMRVEESSSPWLRSLLTCCGGLNLRKLSLHFTERGQQRLVVERPCRMGGFWGCPLEMTVKEEAATLGKVVEDFSPWCNKCCQCCCQCTTYTRVYDNTSSPGSLQLKFVLRSSLCCTGRVNNCCGATCCSNDLLIDVLDPQGQLLTMVQKTYAPSEDCSACCRCMNMFSNYIIEFPEQATAAERVLLLAAVFQLDYQLFEKQGGSN